MSNKLIPVDEQIDMCGGWEWSLVVSKDGHEMIELRKNFRAEGVPGYRGWPPGTASMLVVVANNVIQKDSYNCPVNSSIAISSNGTVYMNNQDYVNLAVAIIQAQTYLDERRQDAS